MREIIGLLIFYALAKRIGASSREDIDIIRRYGSLTSLGSPHHYLPSKWPPYNYKPFVKPYRPYPQPDDSIYKPNLVQKPARPNTVHPNYSYQHTQRPIAYYPRPPKPSSADYPNRPNPLADYPDRPNEPNDPYYVPSYPVHGKPYPTKPSETYPYPAETSSNPHTSTFHNSNESPSYQGVKPSVYHGAYSPNHIATTLSHEPLYSYPTQFLQDPSNTYEDEYPSQFYQTHEEAPVISHLTQYLQNGQTVRQDEDSYFDRVEFYPYEKYGYAVPSPTRQEEIYDYPEIVEELGEAVFERESQERSLHRNDNVGVNQKPVGHRRRFLVPYKTWEYKPSNNLLKFWKTKFYHPHTWWDHKIPHYLYYLHKKHRKPSLFHPEPHRYFSPPEKPYPWENSHLPLISTRPATVHRIRNSGANVLDSGDSIQTSTEDIYSDDVFNNYLKIPTERLDGFYQRSAFPTKSRYSTKIN